jgi:hypothetical protein
VVDLRCAFGCGDDSNSLLVWPCIKIYGATCPIRIDIPRDEAWTQALTVESLLLCG